MSTNKVSTSKEKDKFWVEVVPDMGRPIFAKSIMVFLNGKDVTKNCFFARLPRIPFLPVISSVGLFLINEKGKRYVVGVGKDAEAAKEDRKGIVWWKYRKDKPECVSYF